MHIDSPGKQSARAAPAKLHGNKRGLPAYRGALRQRGIYAVELPLALDNRYLALREAKRAGGALRDVRRLRAGGDGVILSVLCRDMIKVCSGKLSEDNMLEYLAGFQSVSPLPQAELYLLPAVLLVQLTFSLADACRKLKPLRSRRILTRSLPHFSALCG